MSRIVRQSKYRHVFGEVDKTDNHYLGLELSTKTGDSYYAAASAKFFAVALRGGAGKTLVLPYEQHGKVPRDQPCLQGHHGDVTDLAFNPFNDNILASAGTDATIKLWEIPDGGLTEKMTEPLATMHGHGKDVTLLQWHPTASNVLASAARDMTVRIWDVENCTDKITIEGCFGGLISDIRWSFRGDLLAASCKDKIVRVFDPRVDSSKPISEVQAHEGAKVVNMVFLGHREQLVTTGFSRDSRREIKVWDPRAMTEPILKQELDQSAGVLMPFWDDDAGMLYIGGKGDGNIRYFEIVDEAGATSIYPVSETKSAESTKGLAMLPKRTVDVGRCETARFIKLLRDKAHLVSFTVPRKSDRFQDDIYPDTLAPEPSTTAEGWFGGATPEPKRMSMDPAKNGGATHASVSTTIRSAGKSAADVASAAAASSGAGGAAAAAGASSGASSGAASSGEVTSLKAQVASLQAALDRAVAAKDAAEAKAKKAEGDAKTLEVQLRAAKEAAAVGPAAAAADGTIPESADEDVVAELAAVKEENETLKHQVAKLKKTVATLMDE
ncbi:hypothetical protein FNF27_03880 [Cafeteria roenbergensis]|uniref:Coronin n=1 Tax=Cafeteria roenbergensis TaxID=33653 RepID=A0A5A8EDH7_CAFRO|nr:hypothetical protein FNF29_03823 [Cafeteria roenbergensis]KAA0174757.1 hypothetical protein FNF27_03880 [Cafeteria roenbergensis]|eukprot:KAA0152596.1 hypothetical protein FNF29_03823 [Cafeteria roenbergensis]